MQVEFVLIWSTIGFDSVWHLWSALLNLHLLTLRTIQDRCCDKTICCDKNLNIHITLKLIETRRIRMSMSVFVFWRKQCIVHGPLIKRFSRKKSENELYQAIVFFLIKVVLYWPWNKTFIHLWKTKQTNLSRPKFQKIMFLKCNSF